MLLRIVVLFSFILSGAVQAEPVSMINAEVRALGMGNAYTALADDESSLFYNPAGLARVRGINLKIFGLDAGVSGVSAYTKIKNLQGGNSSGLASSINALYGSNVWTGLGGESIFTMPMFGFGAYDHGSALIRVDNPVFPNLHTTVVNDFGYVMGVGVPLGLVHLGMDVRYIKRTGTDTSFGAADLADLNTNAIKGQITNWGVGYGTDLGASVVIPAPFFRGVLSVAWKNVGKTEFRSLNNVDIPPEDNDITLGGGLVFDLPLISIKPDVDFTNINRSDLQLTRKINFGIEIGLPILDIRAGFHEGYYTAGVGVNLGLFRVDAATYGVELGDYPGQLEDRRYIAQFTMQLGLGNFSADGSTSGKGSGKNGSSGNSSSNDSIWGTGRLKQRR